VVHPGWRRRCLSRWFAMRSNSWRFGGRSRHRLIGGRHRQSTILRWGNCRLHGLRGLEFSIKRIGSCPRLVGGSLRLSAGTLYGSIKRLLEEGLIIELRANQRPKSSEDDERRRYYRLTPLGRQAAMAEVSRMSELLKQARAHGLVAKSN